MDRAWRQDDVVQFLRIEQVLLMATRIFLMGAIILFFGFQFRAVDTFVLNEKVTRFINEKVDKQQQSVIAEDSYQASLDSYYDFGLEPKAAVEPLPTNRRITPPRWLGWSFLSIGAVLVLTCPLFRS